MDRIQENEIFTTFSDYMKNVLEFKKEFEGISKTWDQLILLSDLSSAKIDLNKTKTNFDTLTNELIYNLLGESLKKVIGEMQSKAQVTVDIVIRNLFERTADIGFLSTDKDIREFLFKYNIKNLLANKDEVKKLKKRFKEYVAKYSVYYDIVLFDTQGNILTKLDDENQTIFKSKDPILSQLENTKEEYLETYRYHDFLPQYKKSLVYSYKVTKNDDNSGEILGYLSLCFKFTNEMETVFENLITNANKEALVLLDSNCEVIASSDKYHIPIGAKLDIELNNPFNITQFAGRDYIIKTFKTNGYEGFFGLGWMGHIMIPLDSAFNVKSKKIKINDDVLKSIMQNQKLFKKELIDIPKKAEIIQSELNRAVWNGNIKQINSKNTEGDFSRSILREVKTSGEKTKETFAVSIERLNETIISSLLDNVVFLASLTIDIMDRNLYERANDCRWWALTSTFKEILSKDTISINDLDEITNILKYINNLYTVYTNLFIYDKNGVIISVSNDKYKSIINTRLQEKWIDNTLKIKDSSRYYVSYFDKTFLYDDKYTFIFNAAINDDDKNNLGGIGIVFDCEEQFKNMLIDALPSKNGKVVDGYFSMFVEKNYGMILSCSDHSHNVGDKIHIDEDFLKLKRNESLSKIIEYRGKYYIVGGRCSNGYREFKAGEDNYKKEVFAFVFIEVGDVDNNKKNIDKLNNYFEYKNIEEYKDIEEIATFYIGNKWLGIKTSQVIESTNINNLEKPITMDGTNHHFKGTIVHKKMLISVLDISKFIDNNISNTKDNEVVIVKYDENNNEHYVGLIVDKLGEMLKVPKSRIKPFEKHLIGGGMLGESIVQPPESSNVSSLLTLLNISKLDELKEETF